MRGWGRRTMRGLVVAAALFVAGDGAWSARLAMAETPLDRHRRGEGAPAARVQGRVTAVDDGMLFTDLTQATLADRGIHDGDLVTVRLGRHVVRVRLVGADTYDELVRDARLAATLDADVVGVFDGDSGVVLVGLGAPLAEWTTARAGVPLVVEKR